MSTYWVNYVCRQLVRDPEFRATMQTVPEQALAPYNLDPEERRALIEGDVATLYWRGANGFLLGYLCRFEVAGLTLDSYGERMNSVAAEKR